MNDNVQTKHFEENAIIYAEEFLRGFNETTLQYYGQEVEEIVTKGYPWIYHTLYRKELGKSVSIAVFVADKDFYLFFVKPTGAKIMKLLNEYGNPDFNSEWTHHTPPEKKKEKVMSLLRITGSHTIGEEINIGGMTFLLEDKSNIRRSGEEHGRSKAIQYGEAAKTYIPQLRAYVQNTSAKLSIRMRYQTLKDNASKPRGIQLTAQQVGHEFESLIRDLLNVYGWQARKIQLPGEGNDFTAIFEGHHILGEAKWEKKPIGGEVVHAFAAKLAPRPQTIGILISFSGFADGAYAAVRRHIQNRTIVFIEKEHLDKIIVSLTDPGEIFSIELRNVYDYLFENVKKK